MKYDLTGEITRGNRRTLSNFRDAMFSLLAKNAFENITVGMICDYADYPRATFYNYFDDKFDLLNYCWLWMTQEIHLEDYKSMEQGKMLYVFFDRIYDFSKANALIVADILSHNAETGYMFGNFRNFMNAKIHEIIGSGLKKHTDKVPGDLLADHISNTLLLVWQWCNVKKQSCTKMQAHKYLEYLVGSL